MSSICIYCFFLLWSQEVRATPRDSLDHLLRSHIPDTTRVMLLLDLANICRNTNPDSTTRCLHDAYQLALKANYPKGQLRALNAVGIKLMQDGDREDAIRNFLSALKIAEDHNYYQIKGALLGNIGALYDELGDGPQALQYYHQTLAIVRREGKLQPEANTLNNLGSVWLEIYHRTDSALLYFRKAYWIKQKIADSLGITSTLNNMSRAFITMNEYDSAHWYLKKALRIGKQTQNVKAQVSTRLRLAELLLREGVLDTATRQAQEALALSQRLKSNLQQLEAYAILAKISQANGKPELANTYLTRQIALHDSLSRADLRAKARNLEQDLRLQQELTTLNSDSRRQKLLLTIMAVALLMLGVMGAGMVRLIRSRNRAIARLHQAQHTLQTFALELENRVAERTAVLAARTAQLEVYAHHNSHRLRAPLASLLGLVDVFRLFRQPPEAQPYLDAIEATAHALDRVVHDIQDSLHDVPPYDPTRTEPPAAD